MVVLKDLQIEGVHGGSLEIFHGGWGIATTILGVPCSPAGPPTGGLSSLAEPAKKA
jgi:hypothetical protein